MQKEKIWHPFNRVWHWVFAVVVIGGWYTGEFMTFSTIMWHFYFGYAVLILVMIRLLWGAFMLTSEHEPGLYLPSLKDLRSYAKSLSQRKPSGTAGHNPLGTVSIIMMLFLLGTQGFTGLFIESMDFFETAPLAHLTSETMQSRMNWWHHTVSTVIPYVLGLHLFAVIFYLIWKKENLIAPMITGWKWVRSDNPTKQRQN
jgi:cytochrome b